MFDEPNEPQTDAEQPGPSTSNGQSDVSAAVERFNTCRWRCAPEDGQYCTHRDVLPFAGKDGFNADAWCLDCAFFKVRRTPKKRERDEYGY